MDRVLYSDTPASFLRNLLYILFYFTFPTYIRSIISLKNLNFKLIRQLLIYTNFIFKRWILSDKYTVPDRATAVPDTHFYVESVSLCLKGNMYSSVKYS
jgi:hypothetical protein